MTTKQSRQLRGAFCRQAKRRNTTTSTFYHRVISHSRQYQKERDAISAPAFTMVHYSSYDDGPARALQQTMLPQTPASPHIFQHTTFSYPLGVRPASLSEIYGLALGICFLVLLMGWLLLVGIRVGIRSLATKGGKATRNMDLECCHIPEERPPKEDRSLLSKLRKVSAEDLIKSAWHKTTDLATSIERDACELRRTTHPPHRLDEEAVLGNTESSGTKGSGSFLRRTCRTADVLSV
ncbi:hypothetical protein F4815DRAFT_409894 [Daldinia loculata]|uniref:uncharacterized protein n=1 Tax=Daldinia loculata TaxID=103429 RepID=UPI0020C4458C|nr:uncharacterized protein F4817DRAFT_67319 [Daldinia loculata]KAI1648516.1 hypothetical protein F4817DRAFT_67319 [Daldinia loculata]KAI2782912.1 hypothetical protein F4815DRAFT_409894 [Daldinia loculata]